jgi:hypothetical protein
LYSRLVAATGGDHYFFLAARKEKIAEGNLSFFKRAGKSSAISLDERHLSP